MSRSLLAQLHGAVLGQEGGPGEGLFQHVRGVAAARLGFFQVVQSLLLVVLVHAVVDDALGCFDRRQATQVRITLLGDDAVHVVVGVVHVGDERNDGRNVAVLGRRGGHEDADTGVTGEITRTADAVHHVGATDVRGVHVAVDVGFQSGVEGNDAQAADDFRMVGNLLRTEHHLAGVLGHVGSQVVHALLRQGEGGTGGELHHTGVDQIEHAVLQYFGSHYQVLELGSAHAVQYGVGNGAYAGLQRCQAVGQTTGPNLCTQEFEQVVSDLLSFFVRLEQRRRNVRLAGEDDAADLGRIDRDANGADAGADVVDGNVFTCIFASRARHVDIVHAFIFARSRGVELDDYVLGGLNEDRRVTYRAGRNDLAVFGDGCRFDDGVVDLGQYALADQFGHVGQMLVDVEDFTSVDFLTLNRVALVRDTLVDDAGFSHGLVSGRAHGGASEEVDLELLFLAALRKCSGEFFRLTEKSEATHAQCHAIFDPRCSFFCGNDFIQECSIANVFVQVRCHEVTVEFVS